MTVLDFRTYLRNAELSLKRARSESKSHLRDPQLAIGTIFAWCAIEAFLNSVQKNFAEISERFEFHEKAFLLEQRIKFVDTGVDAGQFILEGKEYRQIEHKIMFLVARFGHGLSNTELDRGFSLWDSFKKLKRSRDSVVHPRRVEFDLTTDDLDLYIRTAKQVVVSIHEEDIVEWHQDLQ